MNIKRLFLIIFSTIAVIAAAAVAWRVQESEYYKSRLQNKEHPKLWKILFEDRVPELDPLMLGKWQSKDNPRWFKVYYDDYDEDEKLYWGKEWDESEDVFEDDLQYHGNGWFRWEKRGKILHEYATMDVRDVPIYRGYKMRYSSKDSLAYAEPGRKKKVFCFTRSRDSITVEGEDITPPFRVAESSDTGTTNDTKEQELLPDSSCATSLSVSKTSISAPADGKTENIIVTCNTTWEIDHLSGSMYSVSRSNDTLAVTITGNPSTNKRTDSFKIQTTDGNKVQKVSLVQSGLSPSLSVSKTSVSAPAEGKTELITVTCNTQWEIETLSDPMYTVTRNNDTLKIAIKENTSLDSRAAFITIKTKNGTKEQRITLSQNGMGSTSPSKTVYDVHNVLDNYTIQGNQITNFTYDAEDLTVLRNAIKSWGEVRTGAITENGSGIVVYGDDGFQATAKGRDFSNFLKSIEQLKKGDDRIGDITLNKEGNYVIILGNCGYIICGLPKNFEEVINRLNKNNEKILSVSLDDGNNWAYVSAKNFGASTNANLTFMQEAYEKFGKLESVCITEKGIIVCCQNGIYFNNVPKRVVDGIIGFHNAGRKPKVIKFTDSGTYLITDGKSAYAYCF